MGKYEGIAEKVWGWFLPTIMPTLSLIISVLAMDAVGQGIQIKNVDRFFFRLSFILSSVYLFVILMMLLMKPFSPLSTLDYLAQSNLWIGPLQGLVIASLGVFFVKTEKT